MRGARRPAASAVVDLDGGPSRARRRRVQDVSSDESDGAEPVASPARPTSERAVAGAVHRAAGRMSGQELDRKVNNLVRLALFMELKKMPLRRDDINKKVLGDHTKAFSLIFEKAQERLRTIFGMEMAEMPARERVTAVGMSGSLRRSAGRLSTASSARFAVRNVLPREARRGVGVIELDDEDAAQYGILAVILSLIYVSGQVLSERQLIKYVEELRPREDFEKQLLPQFVKQAYLDRHKSDVFRGGSAGHGGDVDGTACFEYTWGPRAKTEWDLDDLVDFISRVYGADAPAGLRKAVEEAGWTEASMAAA